MRRFVIGDVHGCSKALRAIIERIEPSSEDLVVFLGDLIDRGPDSRGVIDLVLELSLKARVIAIRGNHELMLMSVLFGGCKPDLWLLGGGAATLASYGGSLDRIPPSHIDFFKSLRDHHETEYELFIHAGYQHNVQAEKIDDAHRYWNHLTDIPLPHCSGKRVFVGHTPQASGEMLDYGHLVCMDTYCFGGGWLTALNLDTDEVIQASRHGHLRRDLLATIRIAIARWFGKRARPLHPPQADFSTHTQPATAATDLKWHAGMAADNGVGR